MSWILWTMLLSFGCIFIVFLMSCLWIAKEADEKIDQFGPSLNIKHERLEEITHAGTHIRFHTAEVAGLNPASPTMEIKSLAEKSESLSTV